MQPAPLPATAASRRFLATLLLAGIYYCCCCISLSSSSPSVASFLGGEWGLITLAAAQDFGSEQAKLSFRDRRDELRLADCTLFSKNIDDDCDYLNYIYRVVIKVAPNVLMLVCLLLCFPFYLAFRCCCNCCGGRRQSYGYCCPHSKEEEDFEQRKREKLLNQRRASLLRLQRRSTTVGPNGLNNDSIHAIEGAASPAELNYIDLGDGDEDAVPMVEGGSPRKPPKRLNDSIAFVGAEGMNGSFSVGGGSPMNSPHAQQRRNNNNNAMNASFAPTSAGPPRFTTATVAARYTLFDILRAKVMTWIVLCAFAGGLAWGLVGSASLVSAAVDVMDAVVTLPDIIQVRVDGIVVAMEFETYSSSTDSYSTVNYMLTTQEGMDAYSAISDTVRDIKEMIVDNTESIREYIDAYNYIPIIVFAAPCLFPLLGSLCAVFSLRKCLPLSNMFFMSFFGAIMWLLHIVFAVLSIALTDASNEVNAAAEGKLNILSGIAGCDDQTFASVRTTFSDLTRTEAQKLCGDLQCYNELKTPYQNLEDGNVLDCSPVAGGKCSTITPFELFQLMESEISIHANVKMIPNYIAEGFWCYDDGPRCTIPQCSEMCRKMSSNNGGTTTFDLSMLSNMFTPTTTGVPTTTDPSAATTTTVADTSTTTADPLLPTTTAIPPTAYNLSDVGKIAKEVTYTLRGVRKIMNVFDRNAIVLASCDNILALALGPIATPVADLRLSAIQIRGASAVYGLAFLAGFIAMAWGSKRFIGFSLANVELINGEPSKAELDAAAAAEANGGGGATSPTNTYSPNIYSPMQHDDGGGKRNTSFINNSFANSSVLSDGGSPRKLPNKRNHSQHASGGGVAIAGSPSFAFDA